MHADTDQLTSVLSPKSLVIVGASADHAKYTGRTVKYILKYRYPGKLYAVNPGRTEVAGIPCFPAVKRPSRSGGYGVSSRLPRRPYPE